MYTRFLLIAALATVPSIFGQVSPGRVQNLDNLPLSFEPNLGQTDETVRFVARSQGMTVFFTDNEVVMTLHRRERGADRKAPPAQAVIRMKLTGSRAPIEARGLETQTGVSNYFIGADPKGWRTGIPHYGRVSLTSIYDGVDLVSYGNQQKLEYDFVVAPGADPSQVQLAFDGVDSVNVNGDGDLLLHTSLGDVVQKRPRVYQDSASGRVNVAAKYVISRSRRVSFELARYDRTKAVVIDPVVSYSTDLGGSGGEQASAVAVDNSGAAYVTGTTYSADFPHTIGQKIGSDDAFVTKLSAAGNSLVYSTYIGGTANDHGNAIAVDPSGEAYIAGDTDSASSFPQLSAVQAGYGGGFWDAFVVKLSSTGIPLYSTFLGGSDDDEAFGIAVDSGGFAYVTGYTGSTNFPTILGAYQSTNGGVLDTFVTKIATGGRYLLYSTYLGGANEDQGRGIAVDASGSAYVTGWTFSPNFPVVSGSQATLASGSASDAFVTKLNAKGSALIFSTCLGGSSGDQAFGIAVDSSGSAYVTGTTKSLDFPTMGALQSSLKGSSDVFVTKLAPAGSSLAYSTYLGGTQNEIGYGIAVDSTGAAYVAGYTQSADFPTLAPTQAAAGGSDDAFVASINPAGNALVYSTYLGGSANDYAYAIAVDALGEAFVVGSTESSNFPTTAGAFQTAAPGSAADDNAFVTMLSGALTPVGAKLYSPSLLGFITVSCCNNPTLGFAWNPVSDAASYKLDIGSYSGATDYYSQNVGLATSETTTVPAGNVYVRLTTFVDTVSVRNDYVFHIKMLPKGR